MIDSHLSPAQPPDSRIARLAEPHAWPLEQWRVTLASDGRTTPHFDPNDGGIGARLLVLLETPGPSLAPVRFVSRDNPTGTARNLTRFLIEAGIERRDMVLWNTVPWILHAPGERNRALRRAEIRDGLSVLPGLLEQLPALRMVLLAGRVAAQAAATVGDTRPDVTIVTMPHLSPTNVCTSPMVTHRIQGAMTQVAQILHCQPIRD